MPRFAQIQPSGDASTASVWQDTQNGLKDKARRGNFPCKQRNIFYLIYFVPPAAEMPSFSRIYSRLAHTKGAALAIHRWDRR